MKPSLIIIFTFLLSFSYAQPADWGYWETMPLKNVQILTPKMIKEKLSGTTWHEMYRVKWKVQNVEIWESKFMHSYPIFASGWFNYIHIEEDKIYQYKHYFGDEKSVEKATKHCHNNKIFLVGLNDEFLYLCEGDYRTDGKQFYVAKYEPADKEYIERLEIYYCINNTHFTILDRVNYPPVEITDTFCPAPQNPNERAELPFPKIKCKK